MVDLVQQITIETAFFPPVVIDRPLEPGPPNPLLEWLQPVVYIQTPYGSPIRSAPYGVPAKNHWPEIQLALGALALALLARRLLR